MEELERYNRELLLRSNQTFDDTDPIYKWETYQTDNKKVEFYTGLPNFGVLNAVHELIKNYVSGPRSKLTSHQQLLVTLIRLRMNYLIRDIAYHIRVSYSTVLRAFHSTLDVLFVRLRFLIGWPHRDILKSTMPNCFKSNFGTKVTVIIDCFELFTEKPWGSINRASLYSQYKGNETVKYLIGVAPQGVIIFISESWGGRASDKMITQNSELLNHLLPGDVVMADRGFRIEEDVGFVGAKLVMPCFTRGKTKLHPSDVETTRKIANVRIHVERVIGFVVRKYRIFEGILPVELLYKHGNSNVPTIDKIVHVCCALCNLSNSVVPFT